jgi:hypothetical protein
MAGDFADDLGDTGERKVFGAVDGPDNGGLTSLRKGAGAAATS